ncbi:hypothetical protein G7Y89_g1117 [Cudoniella acicularis]|uniref:Rhodopsin domain-containing protein n=1 Tax=Cudoniella acicularis TaxID=354080 RepID=A0A8H4RXP7_9HELO|nr:hypothetical protein G7Y89_g1117 [Cudoniella acicularis]
MCCIFQCQSPDPEANRLAKATLALHVFGSYLPAQADSLKDYNPCECVLSTSVRHKIDELALLKAIFNSQSAELCVIILERPIGRHPGDRLGITGARGSFGGRIWDLGNIVARVPEPRFWNVLALHRLKPVLDLRIRRICGRIMSTLLAMTATRVMSNYDNEENGVSGAASSSHVPAHLPRAQRLPCCGSDPGRTIAKQPSTGLTTAQICGLVEFGILMSSIPYGFGRHLYYLQEPDAISAARLLFISQPPWAWTLSLIKISMACMFLRINRSKKWLMSMWPMILLQLVAAAVCNTAQFLQCVPLQALWDPNTPNVKCWAPSSIDASIYINAGMNISTDIIFSLLPITFIRKLDRPFWEKFVICCLMGLGIMASAASLVKTLKISTYEKSKDPLFDGVDISIWSILEEQLGMIAACVPCLKNPCERFLRRMGLISFYGSGSRGSAYARYRDNDMEDGGTIIVGNGQSKSMTSDESSVEFYQMENGRIRRKGDVEHIVDGLRGNAP